MKVKITRAFRDSLNKQLEYIARDKPGAARNFKTEIIRSIKEIPKMPYGVNYEYFEKYFQLVRENSTNLLRSFYAG